MERAKRLPPLLAVAFLLCIAHAQTASTPDARFRQFDKNGDGKVTPEELGMPNLFPRLDKNNDGFITPDESAAFSMGRGGNREGSTAAPQVPVGNFKPRAHGQEATTAGLKPEALAKLDIAMQQSVAAKEVAGVVVLIHHNGQRGYFEAFGMQDIEAKKEMPEDAIFRLQSMTKPIIAVAALTLYDEGKFTLDEPISKHLSEWTEPMVLENGQLVTARNAITPRMLMSHSSGLYYGDIEKGAFAGGAVMRDANMTLEAFSKELAKKPLKFQPGEGYQYGHSIDILGRYVEVVAGQPLDEILKSRVLGPLKMVDTDFWVPQEKAARVAQLYVQRQPGELQRGRAVEQVTKKPTLFLGGQGLCSTAVDYERFCLMLMHRGEVDGVRILKPETVDLMFQNHLKIPGRKYGLGGAVDGDGGYAWGGANGTQFWIDQTNHLFAVFMVQAQRYRAPTFRVFHALANEAAAIASSRAGMLGGA